MAKGDRVEMDEEALSDAVEGKEGKEGKEKKKIHERCIKKGIEVESKEHPSFDEKIIKTLVMDHLKEDKDYYKDYYKEEEK